MRFAVVEYSSKSNEIWKHTATKPNFLADPNTEIDATSFGTWVSILEGEHIPLLKFAKHKTLWRKAAKRLTGSWPSFSVNYFNRFDVLLIVHQLSDAHELVGFINKLKAQEKSPFIIGVPTQPFGILRAETEVNTEAKSNLINFIQACDQFISIDKATTNWYEKISGANAKYFPQPYPVKFAQHFAVSPEQKEKTIMVAGVTQRENIALGQKVAAALQKKFPEYKILVPKVADLDYDFKNLQNADYKILDFERWQEHLQTLAKTRLVINTDFIHTRGRLQMDCAAVQTLSLGSNSDAQLDLCPELAANSDTSLEKIISLGEKLLADDTYYRSLVEKVNEKISFYDYDNSRERFLKQFQA